MRKNSIIVACAAMILLVLAGKTRAQSVFDGIRFSGQFFMTYEYTESNGNRSNAFGLERGYITFRKNIGDNVGIRFTQDVTIDQEGDGEGDIELRLKYAFVHYNFADYGLLHSPMFEFGVVRRPWTDFEQGINDYRMQGSMFLDRERIAPSADYGLIVSAMLGPTLENARDHNLSSSTAGRYGSFALGVFNGGGYAELEKNNNKVVEGRLSLRPFWQMAPGIQISYATAYGRGNSPSEPTFEKHLIYLSYSSKKLVSAVQYYHGIGDVLARRLDQFGDGLPMNGYSGFSEIMPFQFPLSLVARYDVLNNRDADQLIKRRGLAGVAWRFSNGSKIMIDFERDTTYPLIGQEVVRNSWEIATEIRF